MKMAEKEPFVPYRPFPSIIEAYYIYELSIATLKTFKLCDGTLADPSSSNASRTNSKDAIFSVEVHTALFPRKPLGMKPGLILHNGPSHKDPILSAAGAESYWSASWWAFNPNSIVFLPPVHPTKNATKDDMVAEAMVAERVDGDDGVAFRISIVVGNEGQERVEGFEWRKIKDRESKTSGFQLFSLNPPPTSTNDEPSSGASKPPTSNEPVEHRKPLAIITWPKATSYLKKAFTLELISPVFRDGSLGDRGTIMVVTTALRLWYLRNAGQTSKGYVGVASKSH